MNPAEYLIPSAPRRHTYTTTFWYKTGSLVAKRIDGVIFMPNENPATMSEQDVEKIKAQQPERRLLVSNIGVSETVIDEDRYHADLEAHRQNSAETMARFWKDLLKHVDLHPGHPKAETLKAHAMEYRSHHAESFFEGVIAAAENLRDLIP